MTKKKSKGILAIKFRMLVSIKDEPAYQRTDDVVYKAKSEFNDRIAEHIESHQLWVLSNGKYGAPFSKKNKVLKHHLAAARYLNIPLRFPINTDLEGMDLRFLRGFSIDFEGCNLKDVKLTLDNSLLRSRFEETKNAHIISLYDEKEKDLEVVGFRVNPETGKIKNDRLYPYEEIMISEGKAKICNYKKLFSKTIRRYLLSRQDEEKKCNEYMEQFKNSEFRMNM